MGQEMLTLSEHPMCSCCSIRSLLCTVLSNRVCLFIQFIWPVVSMASQFPFWYFQTFILSYISSIVLCFCLFVVVLCALCWRFFLDCPFFLYSPKCLYLCYFYYSKLSFGFLKIHRAFIVIKFTRIARHCVWTINVARTYIYCMVKWKILLL